MIGSVFASIAYIATPSVGTVIPPSVDVLPQSKHIGPDAVKRIFLATELHAFDGLV